MEEIEPDIGTLLEYWELTGRLRWAYRDVFDNTLQQEWLSNDGKLEWRDVPTAMFPND